MNIARRFDVPGHRIWEILNSWSVRALELGHVQIIDQQAFATCCRIDSGGSGPELISELWVRPTEENILHALA